VIVFDGLPKRALSVGVTGHRPERLAGFDLTALKDAVVASLTAITQAADKADIRLVSSLAEGADSIVADSALAQNWQLDVVLPFFREVYAADFDAGDVREAHTDRLAQASAVFELPGERAAKDAAYERAGRVVLAQSDVLIAVWDSGPVRGRGGAAQIVAEAVLQGIPVIQINPNTPSEPRLLWDGLEEVDLGQQTIDTVARGDLSGLGPLVREILDEPDIATEREMLTRFLDDPEKRWAAGLAYPILLAIMGVRRLRWSDLRIADTSAGSVIETTGPFADRAKQISATRYARADAAATRMAQLFRSGYVTNFTLAALAVVLSLLGLALPAAAKAILIALELGAIGIILFTTRIGNHAAWHRRWLDSRALAERLRCLAVSAQLGDLDLRADLGDQPSWVAWYTRATARELGLPDLRVNGAYLAGVRKDLIGLLEGQITYLDIDARRMHRLEHRLHVLGTLLFAATAFACLGTLVFKAMVEIQPNLHGLQSPITITATIASAALPAIGAAIYGIRMQGDFAGIAGRNEALAHQLKALRVVIDDDALTFDTLRRRIRRASDLLTNDLARWLQTYHARPLALPG
jgi:hypothetical protein